MRREDGAHEKKLGKNNQNHSGSSGRQSCIVVCCGSVYRAEWDHYGRCDWYRSYDQPLFSGKPIDDYFGDQCGAVRSRCSIFGKEVCIDNDHQFLYLSNIPVDGTVHSGNRQSDGE